MKTNLKMTKVLAVATLVLFGSLGNAADTSVATMNVSANVPVVFSVISRGVPGDLDLTPNSVVNNRTLGLFHFKYNANVASMTIKSDTASGVPEDGGTAYDFAAATPFKVAITAGCSSVAAAYNAPFALTQVGTDIKSLTAAALTSGIEEDCELTGTWGGTTTALPLSGKYSLSITLTMVSI